jgi:hypothetical protein
VAYIVNFCPDSELDQESSIVVVTEREKFEIPIICNGVRGQASLHPLSVIISFHMTVELEALLPLTGAGF